MGDGVRKIRESGVARVEGLSLAGARIAVSSIRNLVKGSLMNKAELIDQIAKKSGLTKADAERALNATVEAVQDAVTKGDSVALVGFGTFEAKDRAARNGRNPATGKEMKIAASRVPRFRPGSAFRASVAKKAKK